jgi:hypothetical protein
MPEGRDVHAEGAKEYYRYDLRAEQRRLLEYANVLALRTRLAGLLKFATAFCKDANGRRRRLAIRFSPSQTAFPSPIRPASGIGSANALADSSQGCRSALTVSTIKI